PADVDGVVGEDGPEAGVLQQLLALRVRTGGEVAGHGELERGESGGGVSHCHVLRSVRATRSRLQITPEVARGSRRRSGWWCERRLWLRCPPPPRAGCARPRRAARGDRAARRRRGSRRWDRPSAGPRCPVPNRAPARTSTG